MIVAAEPDTVLVRSENMNNENETDLNKLVELLYRTSDCAFCKSIGYDCQIDNDPDGTMCRGCLRENIINAVNCSVV